MEEKTLKKESNFVDNIAYKSKFQFILWVNENTICQRYFKINGFNEKYVYTKEFAQCMEDIVDILQEDLVSKSRIFMWYTNMNEPFKLEGFVSNGDFEKYGDGFVKHMLDSNIKGKIQTFDGKIFNKSYMDYDVDSFSSFNDNEKPEYGEVTFKFSFLIDDIVVFEKIWDGNVYPKFVRNGVDLTNAYSNTYNLNTLSMNFSSLIVRRMEQGRSNLTSKFIDMICNVLSNITSEPRETVKTMEVYKNNNVISKDSYDKAVSMYGVVQPCVTGHIDIEEKNRKYSYSAAENENVQSWRSSLQKKTFDYLNSVYPSQKQIDYIEKYL